MSTKELKEARRRMLDADSQAEADRWFGRILVLIDELPAEPEAQGDGGAPEGLTKPT